MFVIFVETITYLLLYNLQTVPLKIALWIISGLESKY